MKLFLRTTETRAGVALIVTDAEHALYMVEVSERPPALPPVPAVVPADVAPAAAAAPRPAAATNPKNTAAPSPVIDLELARQNVALQAENAKLLEKLRDFGSLSAPPTDLDPLG